MSCPHLPTSYDGNRYYYQNGAVLVDQAIPLCPFKPFTPLTKDKEKRIDYVTGLEVVTTYTASDGTIYVVYWNKAVDIIQPAKGKTQAGFPGILSNTPLVVSDCKPKSRRTAEEVVKEASADLNFIPVNQPCYVLTPGMGVGQVAEITAHEPLTCSDPVAIVRLSNGRQYAPQELKRLEKLQSFTLKDIDGGKPEACYCFPENRNTFFYKLPNRERLFKLEYAG